MAETTPFVQEQHRKARVADAMRMERSLFAGPAMFSEDWDTERRQQAQMRPSLVGAQGRVYARESQRRMAKMYPFANTDEINKLVEHDVRRKMGAQVQPGCVATSKETVLPWPGPKAPLAPVGGPTVLQQKARKMGMTEALRQYLAWYRADPTGNEPIVCFNKKKPWKGFIMTRGQAFWKNFGVTAAVCMGIALGVIGVSNIGSCVERDDLYRASHRKVAFRCTACKDLNRIWVPNELEMAEKEWDCRLCGYAMVTTRPCDNDTLGRVKWTTREVKDVDAVSGGGNDGHGGGSMNVCPTGTGAPALALRNGDTTVAIP